MACAPMMRIHTVNRINRTMFVNIHHLAKENGGMRGMVGVWCPVGTGVAEPLAVDGVAGDRTRAGRPTLASLWASTIAENCADSKAGRRWKALRSEDDGDATMSDARCAVSMIISAIAQ